MELDIVGLLETDLHVSGTSYTPGAIISDWYTEGRVRKS